MLYSYRSAWQPPDRQNAVRICKYMLYVWATVEWKIPDGGACSLCVFCVQALFEYS